MNLRVTYDELEWSGNDVNMMPRYDNLKKKINFIF